MDYQQALDFIHSANRFGSKLGLANITALLDYLGNPHRRLRFVHVAGTNGKGSTSAYIASVLHRAGYRTGLYTSPYVFSFNERIRVNGENISDGALAACVGQVKDAVDAMLADGLPHPTEFELVTAAAFCHYAAAGCDIVVLEVGLGGRFDATNVIGVPEAAVITAVGMDHMQYLGDTVEDIAFEKCGIIKPGSTVISYPLQPDGALRVIEETCRERGCVLAAPDMHTLTVHWCGLEGAAFDYGAYRNIQIGLVGRHQIYNCITAVKTLEQLRAAGWDIPDNALYEGLHSTRWPGRLERIGTHPLVLLDGAHNVDGVRSLANALNELVPGRKIVAVFGMLRDKQVEACVAELARAVRSVIFTTVDNPRAASAEELYAVGAPLFDDARVCVNPQEALEHAVELCGPDGAAVAAGSLYMLGALHVQQKMEEH